MMMKILYITRKFPPSTGGMQTQSLNFYKSISAREDVELIGWGGSQIFLPFFMIYALARSFIAIAFFKKDIVQLGDIVLSPLGYLIKLFFRVPVLAVSHGRDSAYNNILYNTFVLGSARKLDKIICVSRDMKARLSLRGLPEDKLSVVPNGIDVLQLDSCGTDKDSSIDAVERKFGLRLKGKNIILSMSRLVPKKGINEFLEKEFLKIIGRVGNTVILICGEGPERNRIESTVKRLGLKENAYLLGNIEHGSSVYKALFTISKVFVMPNRRVKDDAEGFGIVALEAAINSVPVVAYEVDGIAEAIKAGKNGVLVKEGDIEGFSFSVCNFLQQGEERDIFAKNSKDYVVKNFAWPRITDMYMQQYALLKDRYGSKKRF